MNEGGGGMKCPICAKEMTEQNFGGVNVDVCKDGCKGIWFDWMELIKLDEKDEGLGGALKEAMEFPRVNDANRAPLLCPKCGIKMHSHKYQQSRFVNVDECYNCGGFFLDSGELRAIKEKHMTDQEEKQYAEQMLADMPEYQRAKQNLEKEKQRAAAVHGQTRFLRLSYYLTGK
jgi:uncharacterized protein